MVLNLSSLSQTNFMMWFRGYPLKYIIHGNFVQAIYSSRREILGKFFLTFFEVSIDVVTPKWHYTVVWTIPSHITHFWWFWTNFGAVHKILKGWQLFRKFPKNFRNFSELSRKFPEISGNFLVDCFSGNFPTLVIIDEARSCRYTFLSHKQPVTLISICIILPYIWRRWYTLMFDEVYLINGRKPSICAVLLQRICIFRLFVSFVIITIYKR